MDTMTEDSYQDDYSFIYKHIDLDQVKKYADNPELIPTRIISDSSKILAALAVKRMPMEEIHSIAAIVNQHVNDNNQWEKVYKNAVGMSRQMKSKSSVTKNRSQALIRNLNIFLIQYFKIIVTSFACITMFLIGAPLGAIIKKGGLGFPVLISIIFFIIYYVLSLAAEKQARQDLLEPLLAVWIPNIVLLPIGIFFLRQARKDARLFEMDYYLVVIYKIKAWLQGTMRLSKNAT
jgi:lipopolysaccharide export system permease protein